MTTTTSQSLQRPDASLEERYQEVRSRIAAAATRVGRRPEDVVLVAVTKNASIDQIRQLVELGHVDFGENRVQNLVQRAAQVEEFLERHRQMREARNRAVPDQVRWHMIGHLQRNKVKKIMGRVRLVHSVDSLRLAESLQAAALRLEEPLEILVQVNSSGERSKHGVAPAAARHLVEQLDTMLNLRPRGLMCMAPETEDESLVRHAFSRCREIFEDIRRDGAGGERFDILSMGMSHDFEIAVECGANIVRVGSAIFGAPETPSDD